MKKPIYVFDEATSALDEKTQQEVMFNIRSLSKNAIVLIVSHRLMSITDSDQILLLSEGKIIEEGSHKELLSNGGTYSSFFDTFI